MKLEESEEIQKELKSYESSFYSKEVFFAIPSMLISKILTILLYVPISILIVRGLGPEGFGIYSFCQSLSEYLITICGLGLNVALLRYIPELLAKTNFAGLKRLLLKSALIEVSMCIITTGILILGSTILSNLFNFDFSSYALLTGMLITCLLGKEFINNALTALYKTTSVAILSCLQGLIFLGLLILSILFWKFNPKIALSIFIISLFIMIAASSVILVRFVRKQKQQSPPFGIGRRRVLKLSLPSMVDALFSKLSYQYSEIFFLGYFFGPKLVGFYSLGFSLSFQLVTLIPQALYTLLSSGFAEAYTKNKNAIPDLIKGLFIFLITICFPIACFGLFFFSPACDILYGEKMHLAGRVGSILCLVQFITLFSIPLSLAIVAKEKTLNALWLTLIQIISNLIIDYFLIKYWGIWGAVAAVAANFFITLPIRLYIVNWIVGGIYFPFLFFIRFAPVAFALAALAWYFVPINGIFSLFFAAGLYAFLLFFFIRFCKIIRKSDVRLFKMIGINRLNLLLDFVTGK